MDVYTQMHTHKHTSTDPHIHHGIACTYPMSLNDYFIGDP